VVRQEVLERLLQLKAVCSFSDRFNIVRGNLREYTHYAPRSIPYTFFCEDTMIIRDVDAIWVHCLIPYEHPTLAGSAASI
jgi:hypothetical protein